METLIVGLEKRLQCAVCVGERYRVDVLRMLVPAYKTGWNAEARKMYEAVSLTQRVDTVFGTETSRPRGAGAT